VGGPADFSGDPSSPSFLSPFHVGQRLVHRKAWTVFLFLFGEAPFPFSLFPTRLVRRRSRAASRPNRLFFLPVSFALPTFLFSFLRTRRNVRSGEECRTPPSQRFLLSFFLPFSLFPPATQVVQSSKIGRKGWSRDAGLPSCHPLFPFSLFFPFNWSGNEENSLSRPGTRSSSAVFFLPFFSAQVHPLFFSFSFFSSSPPPTWSCGS